MRVTHEGREYTVQFEGRWHNPPLPGAITDDRVQHTTICRIAEVGGPGMATAAAQCSVADTFSELGGCRRALMAAVNVLHGRPPDWDSPTFYDRQRVFLRQVMPVLSRERAERERARIRTKPGKHALSRAVNRMTEAMALAQLVLTAGPEVAFTAWLELEARRSQSAVECQERSRRKKADGAAS